MIQARTMALILGSVLFSAAGQLLLRSGARQLVAAGRVEFLFSAARNVHVVSGIAAWSVSTIFWLYALRVAPLSRSYGLTSLTYVLVPLASVYVFGEQIRRVDAVGIVLIVLGIACLFPGD